MITNAKKCVVRRKRVNVFIKPRSCRYLVMSAVHRDAEAVATEVMAVMGG